MSAVAPAAPAGGVVPQRKRLSLTQAGLGLGHLVNNNVGPGAHRRKAQAAAAQDQKNLELQMKRTVMSLNVQERPWGMFLCNSVFRIAWDFLTLIFLIYISAATPYVVAFNAQADDASPAMAVIDTLTDIFFIADIALNFRTGFYPKSKTVECTDPTAVAVHYFKTWFILDVLASFPYHIAIQDTSDANYQLARTGKVLKVTRLMKLVRLVKLPVFMDLLDNHFKGLPSPPSLGFSCHHPVALAAAIISFPPAIVTM
jgi:hypothetical protein